MRPVCKISQDEKERDDDEGRKKKSEVGEKLKKADFMGFKSSQGSSQLVCVRVCISSAYAGMLQSNTFFFFF